MAIQFNCPYCTTEIRVPDSAGGKRGQCPRCRTGILVPKVEPKAAPSPAPKTDAPQPARKKKASARENLIDDQPDFSGLPGAAAPAPAAAESPAPPAVEPVAGSPETPAAADAPNAASPPSLPLGAASTAARVDTPYSRALQRRRKRRRFFWVPIVFGALLVGGVAIFFLVFDRDKLEGTLSAKLVPDAEIESRKLTPTAYGAEKAQIDRVAKDIQEKRLMISDQSGFAYEIVVDGDDFRLRVDSSDTTPLFRVDVKSDKTLRRYLTDHAEQLDKPRERELTAGVKRFFEGAAKSLDGGGQIPSGMRDVLRQRVLSNLLVRSAGYHLVAVIGERAYRCFYEDGEGRLYFALPKSTKKFTLKGRKLADGTRAFPGIYTVEVDGRVEAADTGNGESKKEDSEPNTKTPADGNDPKPPGGDS